MYLRKGCCDDLAQGYIGIISGLTACKEGSLKRAARFIFATLMITIREAGEVLEGQEQADVQLKQPSFYLLNYFSSN